MVTRPIGMVVASWPLVVTDTCCTRKIAIPMSAAVSSIANGFFSRSLIKLCVNSAISSKTAGRGFTRITSMVKGIARIFFLFETASMAMNANMIATRHRLIRY